MHAQIQTSKNGGELTSLKINGREKIHQGENCVDENKKIYWKRSVPVLFPIVGKLKRNQTLMHGKTFEIFENGFVRDMEFEPITKLDNFHSYMLKSNKKTLDRYPYDFSLYTTYRVYENELTVIYKVINDGDVDMPFGIGSKPAFEIDADEFNRGNYYLEFEKEEDKIHFLYLIDGLVGIDYAKNLVKDKKRIPLTKGMFNNDAIIMKGLTSKKISLIHKDRNRKILTMDFTGFPYLSIWSKQNAPFLCIAPCLTTPDTIKSTGIFKEKSNTIILKPKEKFECKYSVEFFDA
ncbi:MAG: hypothetical protein Q4G05_04730 [Clostridia bacterium]|nr:hypothetical protein [Clostridia bacterium]